MRLCGNAWEREGHAELDDIRFGLQLGLLIELIQRDSSSSLVLTSRKCLGEAEQLPVRKKSRSLIKDHTGSMKGCLGLLAIAHP